MSLNSMSSCFRDIWPLSVLGSWPWPFRFTQRHRSRNRWIPHRSFPICFFRQFFGKIHRSATLHTLQTTDRYTTDGRNTFWYKLVQVHVHGSIYYLTIYWSMRYYTGYLWTRKLSSASKICPWPRPQRFVFV